MMIDTYFLEDDDDEDCICMDCGRPISPHACETGPQLCPYCIEREQEYMEEMREEVMAGQHQSPKP